MNGSSKTGIASGIRTPCLRKLVPALLASSHSKPTAQVYVPFVHTSILAVRGGVGACGAIAGTCSFCVQIAFKTGIASKLRPNSKRLSPFESMTAARN